MALTDNLVAYYELDDTTDATGGGATLTNNGTVTFSTGIIDNGAVFTGGTTKYLSRTSDLGITNGTITISLWAKCSSEIASGQWGLVIKGDGGTHVNYIIVYQYNGGTRRLSFNRQEQNVANNEQFYTIAMGTASWHHLVLTYDNTNVSGYVDNTSIGTLAASGDGSGAGADLIEIGRAHGYTDNCFTGTIDEVGVWSRVLTSDEVASLYNSGNGLAYPLTVAGGLAQRKLLLGVGA